MLNVNDRPPGLAETIEQARGLLPRLDRPDERHLSLGKIIVLNVDDDQRSIHGKAPVQVEIELRTNHTAQLSASRPDKY